MSELHLKILSVLIPHVTVSAVLIGLLFNALRRYERRADAIIKRMDENCEAELPKYEQARDEIRASLRAKTDAAVIVYNRSYEKEEKPETHTTLRFVDMARQELSNVVPVYDEIRNLPSWVRVAFAARCARRVSQLYHPAWPKVIEKYITEIEKAVRLAEHASAIAAADYTASNIDYFLSRTPGDHQTAALAANHAVIETAALAANAVYTTAADSKTADYNTKLTATAVAAAAAAGRRTINSQLRHDFEIVYGLAVANAWTDKTPVPPSVFGPLWPDGPPKGWPKPEKAAKELHFEFNVPDDMTIDDAIEFVKQLSLELCKLDVAAGGHGVAIQPPLEMDVPMLAKNPSPQPVLA